MVVAAISAMFAKIIMLFLSAVRLFQEVILDEFLFNPNWEPANPGGDFFYGA